MSKPMYVIFTFVAEDVPCIVLSAFNDEVQFVFDLSQKDICIELDGRVTVKVDGKEKAEDLIDYVKENFLHLKFKEVVA